MTNETLINTKVLENKRGQRTYLTEKGTFVIFLNKEKLTCQCNSLYDNKYIILPCSWHEDQILNSSAGKHSKTI